MEKYCCFLCPATDYHEKNLEDICPTCSLPYGFPISHNFTPKQIGEYKVVQPIDRGFYGATYIVEKETAIRTKKLVLKVVPERIYNYFNKDFKEECRFHAIAAEGAQHIVNIEDLFSATILFDEIEISCHVSILEYIEGPTLKSLLNENHLLKAASIGQIAIDLLKILIDLQVKHLFHNDLHPGNIIIERLKEENKRVGEIDEYLRAVAIDFGSLAGKTLSGDKSDRVGDLHRIAEILDSLSKKILDNPENVEERDYRLASLLEERAHILFPRITNQRTYEFDEVITQIRNAFIQVVSPWKQTLSLRNFKDSYNAQTLSPWFVPSLLVDDDDKWISEICNKGPQVITGMRGCGKTMLIRALQFHARAIPRDDEIGNSKKLISRLISEEYLGLYLSCTRLLDKLGNQDQLLHEPFTRLFLAYALEAVNAIRHLRELNRTSINFEAFKLIAEVVANHVDKTDDLRGISNEYDLERYLKNVLNKLSKSEGDFKIRVNPAIAFPQLAEVITRCSSIWNNKYIFFLLDDVSTRFLNDQNIVSLISSLLFQNENCSFKFTTEAQTLELVINSPGNIEAARIGRDYHIFDLGQMVNEKVHSTKREGISFVEKILYKRAQFHSNHPKHVTPSEILGDSSLQSIAENIAKVSKASEKKGLYYGITAIAGVCVGDIGDVIVLYEMILKKRSTNLPIPDVNQNECYLELCNSRLFDIDRRDRRLFDFAESFAEAAHYLLVQSYRNRNDNPSNRLRQYSSIFINISSGDFEKQRIQIRELIDAGIFNFSGGPQASRTNRQGINPQHQYKLTYRKLYGLNKHIGLAQSDRFELSGEALEEWLNNPKKGKDILIRNLKKEETFEYDALDTEDVLITPTYSGYQKTIFDEVAEINIEESEEDQVIQRLAISKSPRVVESTFQTNIDFEISTIMLGLGFEERTLESLKRDLQLKIDKAFAIKYNEIGKSKEILDLLEINKINTYLIDFDNALNENISSKDILYDITGLPQSIIFYSIYRALKNHKKAYISYTEAVTYYPLENDVKELLLKYEKKDKTYFLESLGGILKGENGPYHIIPLLPMEINSSTRRVLICFSSPKHERLYTFLDQREYDKIIIIVSSGESYRQELARIAGYVALRKYSHAEVIEINHNNLQQIIDLITLQYQNYFVNQNFSFEIAITGSKIQTLACAAICSVFRVNQCWYVQPSAWDANRFTKGVGKTHIYSISRD